MENRIVINTELCKGCGFCVEYCPKKILKIGKEINTIGYQYAVQVDGNQCTMCGICALMCPDAAINVYKEDK